MSVIHLFDCTRYCTDIILDAHAQKRKSRSEHWMDRARRTSNRFKRILKRRPNSDKRALSFTC